MFSVRFSVYHRSEQWRIAADAWQRNKLLTCLLRALNEWYMQTENRVEFDVHKQPLTITVGIDRWHGQLPQANFKTKEKPIATLWSDPCRRENHYNRKSKYRLCYRNSDWLDPQTNK